MARKKKNIEPPRFVLPEGFEPHYGGECPVDPSQYVEPLIRTAEGFGSAGVCRAKMHDWREEAHDSEGGLGAVVGYRVVTPGETPAFDLQHRF